VCSQVSEYSTHAICLWGLSFGRISVYLDDVLVTRSVLVRMMLIHKSPKYLERNLAQEKFEGFFPLNYAILSFGKFLNYSSSGFQRGDIF